MTPCISAIIKVRFVAMFLIEDGESKRDHLWRFFRVGKELFR